MAGVFTQDINRALRLSEAFDSGVVGVNCVSTISFSCPFGGTKESGIGRELGIHALHAYTEPKTVLINLTYWVENVKCEMERDLIDERNLNREVQLADEWWERG